jgi:phenylpropionate dioxygenase-like ring-hydroxylating dioxygenase large terminal subunit
VNVEALRHYWYPVALASDLGDRPLGVMLLGEPLVVFRARAGVAVLGDLCIHRGSPLSMGLLEDGCIVCAYHAWTYASDGTCVRIPALAEGQPIPRKARVPAYRAEERYGLIWACLDEPHQPIPPFPEYDDPAYEKRFAGAYEWSAAATRMIENFMDLAHLPWVHPEVLGSEDTAEVPAVQVEVYDDGLRFDYRLKGPPQGAKLQGTSDISVDQRLYFPFTIHQNRYFDGNHVKLFFACQPITATRARRYLWLVRQGTFDSPIEAVQPVLDTIREQDRAIVERQRPELLPLDLSEEMHLQGTDAAAVAYRRLLARVGVE